MLFDRIESMKGILYQVYKMLKLIFRWNYVVILEAIARNFTKNTKSLTHYVHVNCTVLNTLISSFTPRPFNSLRSTLGEMLLLSVF